MYRVLIADDEGIAIDSLTFILSNTYGEKCEVRSARTGRSVIEIAETFRPDIAVMDIQMPGINGIEAIREIRKFSPQTLFIVVSAYDKFDYAKDAIELGVIRYLSKPLDKELFVSTMDKAMEQLDKERARRSNDLKTWEKLETVVPMIETGLVYSLLLQDTSEEDIQQYKNLLDITDNHGYIMLIECGDTPEESESKRSNQRMNNPIGSGIHIQKYYSTIRDVLRDFSKKAIVGQIMMNKIPIFIPHSGSLPDYNERNDEIRSCQLLISRLESKADVEFRIGIGSVQPISDIKRSYQEALRSLRSGSEQVSHADDLPVACDYEENYPIGLEKELFAHIEAGQTAEAEDAADRFFTWMEDTQVAENASSVRLKALEFVLWAEHIGYEDGSMGTYRFTDRSDYMEICQSYDFPQLHTWFVTHMAGAAGKIRNKTADRAGSLVQSAIKYIDENYGTDISLDDVSRAVDVSPYYFSKLFKEETGVNFIEYLTNLRMDHAKKLLSDPSVSIRDVCFAVGYQDPNYFSRIFKRATGSTPSEFRS